MIRLLFGSTYEIASTPAARLLAVTPMAFALGYLMSAALNSRRRYRLSFTASAIAVLVNVVANLILIPLYSERGAAAATSGAYALEAIVLFFMLAREAERPHLLGPAPPAIVATIPLAVLLIALDLPIVRELALGGAVYLSVWFLLARRFAREQVDVLLSLVGR